ncbi:MAG: hypothetical protein RJA44_1782, partial [Pseudomonadota bacterium]
QAATQGQHRPCVSLGSECGDDQTQASTPCLPVADAPTLVILLVGLRARRTGGFSSAHGAQRQTQAASVRWMSRMLPSPRNSRLIGVSEPETQIFSSDSTSKWPCVSTEKRTTER